MVGTFSYEVFLYVVGSIKDVILSKINIWHIILSVDGTDLTPKTDVEGLYSYIFTMMKWWIYIPTKTKVEQVF